MISKCACQQCGVNIEFDTEQNGQFVECPQCQKQTRLIVSTEAHARVTLPPEQLGKRASIAGLTILNAILILVSLGLIASGVVGEVNESVSTEGGSAIREAVCAVWFGSGVLLFVGCLILYALCRLISKTPD